MIFTLSRNHTPKLQGGVIFYGGAEYYITDCTD